MRARFLQALFILLFIVIFPLIAAPEAISSEGENLLPQAERLYQALDWEGVLRLIPPDSTAPPELQYYRGMALARLGQWQQARDAFELGKKLSPRNKKFLQELAGVHFKLGDYSGAKSNLLKALKIDPADRYNKDFLASLYLWDGNVEAAIKFWNPDGPLIENVQVEPPSRLNIVVSDRAFVFAPSSLLKLDEFRTTGARLEQLKLYPRPAFQLKPRSDGKFDLFFRAHERNGLGDSSIEKTFSVLRESPGLSLHLDLFNLSGSGGNSESWARLDPEKFRLMTRFSAPLLSNPAWRYDFYLEGRRENWDLTMSYPDEAPLAGDLRLRRLSAGFGIQNIPSWRWKWKTGVEFSYRDFDNPPTTPSASQVLFLKGGLIRYQVHVENILLQQPERHLKLGTFATANLGKFFASSKGVFSRLQGGLKAEWNPGASGQDWFLYSHFRMGRTGREIPFDELFVLGLERDNDLWLRGLVATHDRKRGSGLLGAGYLLFNVGCEKRIYRNPLFNIFAGPFLDSGRSYDRNGLFGADSWHWNTGIVVKTRLYNGLTVDLILGRDFQSARNGFYVTPSN